MKPKPPAQRKAINRPQDSAEYSEDEEPLATNTDEDQTKKKAKLFDDFLVKAAELRRFESAEFPIHNQCHICQMVFSTADILKRHQRKVHSQGKAKYPCSDCDKSFNRKQNLKCHRLKEHEGRGFRCNTCSKLFLTSQSLRHHRKTHESAPEAKCIFCDKAFNQERYMREHAMGCCHNPMQLKLKCPSCPKVFHHRKSLNHHIKTKHS